VPNWAVVLETPLADAYRPMIWNLALSAGGALAVAALAAGIGLYLSRRLAAPMSALTETAARIAGGQLELVAPVRGTAEVSRLASAFNTMTGKLRELIQSQSQQLADLHQAQQALQQSLQEKVVLLKEIHHRVKNNLQIINSLLNLQAGKAQSPEVQMFLRDTQSRIRSMSLLHQSLYSSGNFAGVGFRDYVNTVCSQVSHAYATDSPRIHLRQEIADVTLSLDQAIPAGLILNELVSNAFKHAFVGRTQGEITVRFQPAEDQHYTFVVADDGIGLPHTHAAPNSASLGLRLVEGLVEQLDGTLSIYREGGSTFHIVFPKQPS
jgi:two-component sensor histidine kinase/HAMP domain-containing protein